MPWAGRKSFPAHCHGVFFRVYPDETRWGSERFFRKFFPGNEIPLCFVIYLKRLEKGPGETLNGIKEEENEMSKRILSLALALMLALTVFMTAASADAVYMYLYAPTGRTVNVRTEPSTAAGSATVITQAPIGTQVEVKEFLDNNWAVIYWGSDVAYVKSEFLSTNQRAPGGGAITPGVSDKEKAMDSLTGELKTYKQVSNSYTIYPAPKRASGFVNFRLAPVQYGKEYYRVYANNALTVLGETRGWYQVRDEATGVVGYIVKSLTSAR